MSMQAIEDLESFFIHHLSRDWMLGPRDDEGDYWVRLIAFGVQTLIH
jgi:hypothetical protein